ncbi:Gfo/Idh/MocA family oxidoreductase [Actinoplanes sp. NPDC049316]|uniref:Gfo/Idh/MocA family protein n=1 Tax=Actinoplanes sp. NPDC049316 TaxID=3154727 RepID=UPI003412FD8D
MRSGIIGTGFIGGVHARAVHAAGGVLSRVAAGSPREAAVAAERLHALSAAASAEELISAADVDVVHICTPNALHVPLALAALQAGKHVICEKPLATGVADARRLVDAAAEARVVTAVPFVYRFYATVREARARIGAGEAGRLWLLHGSYLQDWLAGGDATNWRVDPALGGASRTFGDIGVHWCDLMEFATGHRISRLVARLAAAYPDRPTEDGAAVLFDTDRGASGSVVVSQATPGRKNRLWFSFDGPDASYAFDQELPDALWVGGQRTSQVVPRGPDTLSESAAAYSGLPAGHPQGYQDCFTAFVADVYGAIGGQKPDGLPTFTDGLRAAVLTAAVVESAAQSRWVEVPR